MVPEILTALQKVHKEQSAKVDNHLHSVYGKNQVGFKKQIADPI